MKFGERLDVPKQIEKLNEAEQVQRLHHEFGVIYDRVFLTGNWGGYEPDRMLEDKTVAEDIKTNMFEDKVVNDRTVFADALRDFLRDAGPTVPSIMSHEDLMSGEGRDDFNRVLFLKVAGLTLGILERTAKDINSKELEDVLKSFDANIHRFRDFSINPNKGGGEIGVKKGMRTKSRMSGDEMKEKARKNVNGSDFDSETEDGQAAEGLRAIHDELLEIARRRPPEII